MRKQSHIQYAARISGAVTFYYVLLIIAAIVIIIIIICCCDRSVVLHVDNVQVGEARMPATEAVIDDMLGDAGGLYIGGMPRDGDFEGLAASLLPLTRGCISQLVIND